jgi:hypothetical protein
MTDAKNKLVVGTPIRIVRIEDWLLKDLLPHEQAAIRECVGKTTRISEIDRWGGLWVSFTDDQVTLADGVIRGGPTFLVLPEWLEPLGE